MTANHIRESSRMAYDALKVSGKLADKQQQIVDFLARHPGCDFSRKEIEKGTGLQVNCVAGRVKELLDLCIVAETQRRRCRETGNSIRPVQLVQQRFDGMVR